MSRCPEASAVRVKDAAPVDPAAVVDHHGPERVVPGPLQQTLPPEPRVRLDRAVVRPRPAGEARHHVVEVAVGVHQTDLRQVAPRRHRQCVERDPVRVPGPCELVAQAPVRLEHGGVQRRQLVTAVPRHVHHGADRCGGESRSAPLGDRRHAPDPRTRETASAEPLREPEFAGRRRDDAVDVGRPHVFDREAVLALERSLQREVQRGRQHASDLLAVVFARDPDVGFHGRATIRGYIGQTQGDAPHFGQPAA